MKIRLVKPYKSLRSFESEKLPNFTVITGKNGSGKTQLLEVLKDANNPNQKIVAINPRQPKLIQFEGIEDSGFYSLTRNTWSGIVQNFEERWFNIPVAIRSFMDFCQKNKIPFEKIKNSNNTLEKFLTENSSLVFQDVREKTIKFESKEELHNLIAGARVQQYESLFSLVSEISDYLDKEVNSITESDFYKVPINPKFITGTSLFNPDFSKICFIFCMNRYINEERHFRKEKRKEKNNSIDPKEYSKKQQPPWVEFNELLMRTNVDYEVIGIDENRFSPEIKFSLKLQKKSTKSFVSTSSLSSGEKVVFGLLMKL